MITNVLNVILSAVVSGFWSQSPQRLHDGHKDFYFLKGLILFTELLRHLQSVVQ